MSGQETGKAPNILVEELAGYSDQEQADKIAQHYAMISNQYEAIKTEDFPGYKNKNFCPPTIEPMKVHQTIKQMNIQTGRRTYERRKKVGIMTQK